MPDIENLIEGAKAKLAKILDENLHLLVEAIDSEKNAVPKQHINLNFTQSIA